MYVYIYIYICIYLFIDLIRAQHLTATAFIKPTHNCPPVSTGFACQPCLILIKLLV